MTPSEVWTTGYRTPYGLAMAPDGHLWRRSMVPRAAMSSNPDREGQELRLAAGVLLHQL